MRNMLVHAGAWLFRSSAFICLGLMVCGSVYAQDHHGLTVAGAWIRLAPPALKTHGGYMTISNSAAEADALVAASSENYRQVQVHVSRMEGGISVMEELASVEIPAGGKVAFQPGGLHFMLIGAKATLEAGASVPIRLTFRSGTELNVEGKMMSAAPGESEAGDNTGGGHAGHHTH